MERAQSTSLPTKPPSATTSMDLRAALIYQTGARSETR
jgi:hypothetical protein